MCFSAEASFGAGIVLTIIGVSTMNKILERAWLPFSAIPLLFAAQQFTEGFVWMALEDKDRASWLKPATYMFLIFAQALWPFWVPFSVLLIEKERTHKRILFAFTIMATLLSVLLIYQLFSNNIKAEIKENHIRYVLGYPEWFVALSGMFYFFATVVSLFVSSLKKMLPLAVTILAALVISKLFFHDYVISVWCFFAAVISSMIYFIVQPIPVVMHKN